MYITSEHIEEFKRDGIIVIENILTKEEVDSARKGFHDQLQSLGIDHNAILEGIQPAPNEARIKSPISRIFYARWKLLNITLNPKIYQALSKLIAETFASGNTPGFEHPMGKSDDILMLIDRVCWRLPDHIRAEGGLGLHLDRNPKDPYLLQSHQGKLSKWRPIQSFVSLTDHYGGESGGLKVVKGFHLKNDFFNNLTLEPQFGEFYRMGKDYPSIEKQLEPINVPAGSLVCWDNRLPHATCKLLTSYDSREVVYLSCLPNISLNQDYIKLQRLAILQNHPPPVYFDENNPKEISDRDWDISELNDLQKKIIGF